jgi:RNA polymerase primary sigma factor
MKIENLDKFLQEIGHAPLLSADQELELLKAIREKGSDCYEMEQLSQSSMRFMVALAVQYKNCGLKLEELIPTGVEGLGKAALSYDFDSDIPFIKYAVPLMRKCLEEAVAKK